MPSLMRRRRPSRRRATAPVVLALVAVAVVVALLLAGIADVGARSGPYYQAVDRSFAAQAGQLVERSNRTGARLRTLLATLPSPQAQRTTVQWTLDTLVSDADAQSRSAALLASPPPADGAGPALASVFAGRALALEELRSGVDGLLGMAPLPVPSGPGSAPSPTAVPTLKPAGWATAMLTRAGARLQRADRAYVALGRSLAAAPGRPRLPRSAWVPDAAAWASGPVAALVAQLAASASLAPVHRLSLVTEATRLDPGALPPAPAVSGSTAPPAGVSVLPPTSSLQVTAVVANDGNVAEQHAQVSASLQAQGASSSTSVQRQVEVGSGGSVAVVLPRLAVQPGTTYTLTLAVRSPAAQSDRSSLEQQVAVQVAPAASSTGTPTAGG